MYDAAFSPVDPMKLNPLTNTRATLGIAGGCGYPGWGGGGWGW